MMVRHNDLSTCNPTSRRNEIVRQRLTHEAPSNCDPILVNPEPTPAQMDLITLMRRCATESERFYRGQQHDTRYSYELFRRALVERNESAWEQLFHHYSGLVEGWVRRSGAFSSSGESSEYFVVGAFTNSGEPSHPNASTPSLPWHRCSTICNCVPLAW